MAKSDYSEDRNVQEPAAAIFADELGWQSVFAFNTEDFGPHSLLGRNDQTEVVLVRELDQALSRLNPDVDPEMLVQARLILLDSDPTKDLLQHNQEKWRYLRDGITLHSPTGQADASVHIRVIDFDDADNNTYIAVRELWVKYGPYTKRCDIIGFVNGLPLVFVELKRHDKGLQAAFDDNYTDYKHTIPHLFYFNAFVVVSNGLDARYGSITSSWDHFYRWKRLHEDDPDPAPKPDAIPLKPILPILLHGMCSKQNLLDIIENYILFDASEELTVKVVARNHQYLGVNRAIAKLQSDDEDVQAGKLGVFWHTQGSGKSYSMVFFCQKAHRKISARYTFVLLTDRKELDEQLFGTFVGCGISTNKKDKATGAENVERLLKDENKRYVFSLIHKFHKRVQQPWNERQDIIVISDEAHRTQYGRLATRMRMALKNAKFLGFTGTPLIDAQEKSETERVFGRYVSVYDFQRAVADGATLPLTYENRGEKLHLVDDDLNQRIQDRIDVARKDGELTQEQEEKLYRELARDYPVLTSNTHLDDVAADFVDHFSERWRVMEAPTPKGQPKRYGGIGKALMVCIDKVTCVKMALKIRAAWDSKNTELQAKLAPEEARLQKSGKAPSDYVVRLRAHIVWMQTTQIHPVFSTEQNEVKQFEEEGIDVIPYRNIIAKGINGRDIDTCFKDDKHPFRVAIVCAMWLTGFDVKSLATLYLDKPMKGHTLMQAIARVNRVAPHKKYGLVVDYNGMLKSLRAALATYGQRKLGGDAGVPEDPFFDEEKALIEFGAAIKSVELHLRACGFELDKLVNAQGKDVWQPLLDAENAVCSSVENKKTFQVLAEDVADRHHALFPHPGLQVFEPQENAIDAIYRQLQKPRPKVDIAAIMQEIRGVIDDALELHVSGRGTGETPISYPLSGIDFERLRVEFSRSPYKEKALLTLQERVQQRIERMMRANPTCMDFYQRYLEIVAEYNKDKDETEIQKVFEALLKLHDSLDNEEKRYVELGFENARQLAIFDLLSKDVDDLEKRDIKKIKKAAKEVLAIVEERRSQMKALRDRATLQAQIKTIIIDKMLEELPEEYSSEDVEQRAEWVFHHLEQQILGQWVH